MFWIYIVGLLEKAAKDCRDQGIGANDGEIKLWDQAVALYVGSGARHTGKGGYLLYSLANEECYRFGRCRKGETAPINEIIVNKFNGGQKYLQNGKCASVLKEVNDIKSLMTVPLIQAALRAMYALDVEDIHMESTQGEAAAYGSALLPLMSDCGIGNGATIYNNLFPGKKGSYEVVKAAFERCYDHLGITCRHVGGLINYSLTGYVKNAEACDGVQPVDGILVKLSNIGPLPSPTSSSSLKSSADSSRPKKQSASRDGVNIALIIGLSALCTFFFVLVVVALNRRKSSRDEREYTTDSVPLPAKEMLNNNEAVATKSEASAVIEETQTQDIAGGKEFIAEKNEIV